MSLTQRLAVCTWSLQPETPRELAARIGEIGIPRVQLHLDPLRESPSVWGDTGRILADGGVSVVSGMMTTVGEDYSSLESIRVTGGIVPDGTWERNLAHFRDNARIAAALGLKLVTFHAGFLPHEETDPAYPRLRERIRQTATLFAEHGIALGFETGQETAETLATFLERLGQPTVGVNFDPANMLLYDQGDPVEAVTRLAPWIRQVHLKDARRTRVPGTWGEEVPVGTGEVDWRPFLDALAKVGFGGDLCFEREAGSRRVEDIRSGLAFIRGLAGTPG